MKKSALAFVLVVLAFGPSNAAFDTGNELLNFCSARDDFSQGICYGLVSGYFEGMKMGYACAAESPKITRKQLRDMVVKDLIADPGQRHLPAAILSIATFVRQFKCTGTELTTPSPKNQ